ncbi:hypothetical protein D9758_016275 [Tetrapyrgos nigripes]|uniref:Uncharacterized protein n=1 Tax=Tetrapyrgos nigripes TaxID=182062 RepID=A0A8H5C7W7_9AGAR|nr:hypothetical protein D9758_016275 [Tetrapyrgos nigripes]
MVWLALSKITFATEAHVGFRPGANPLTQLPAPYKSPNFNGLGEDLRACLPNSTLNHGADCDTAEDIEKDMTDRTGPSSAPVKLDSGTDIDSSTLARNPVLLTEQKCYVQAQLSLSLILLSLSLVLQWQILLGVYAQASQAPPTTFGSATNRLGFCMGFEVGFTNM